MSEFRITEQQLLDVNAFMQRSDDVVITNCLTRTAQESKLFPIMPYLVMSMYDAYYRYPDLLRRSAATVSPEDVGHRARNATCNISKLTGWGVINFYLQGRELLIKKGLLRPEDNLEDLVFMVDWWQRFSAAYHRNGGHRYTLDAHDIAQEHDERVLQVLEADAYEADDALRASAAQFMALGTQYAFLAHCESRVGLQSSGPYNLGGRRLLHTRDFMNLSECDFSWLDGVATDIPFNNLTLAVITDGVSMEITDWASVYTTPEDIRDRIIGVGLYTSDFLTDRYIPVGMDSRRDLVDTLDQLSEVIKQATRKLYRRFAGFGFTQMVEAGIYTYFQAAADIDHMAGTYRQGDWELIDDRTRRLWPLYNEEFAYDDYVSAFATMDGFQAGQNDYYLHPVSYSLWRRGGGKTDLPAPGRSAIAIPAHVLNDHDYSLRVNPNGLADVRGSSTLPTKTGGYTFQRGRLTEHEMNRAAREFDSPLLRAPWRFVDEATVKYHYRNPEVDALYRYTQQDSRLLRDRGAALVRADIDRIRTEAGERPWSAVSEAVTTAATSAAGDP
ncbi:hypothetical protein ACL02T_27760 [Pseudonocardia sp. RS010]|uniref:hypothetical protein n=1 Tax=Pseudonocardia sp. RS010 TaxID=3385979 RepID=UPI00399F8BD6